MLKTLSRSSKLAILQVKEVMSGLPGVAYTHETIETYGDLHKELSLLEGQKGDFFTDALDSALLAGKGDVAVHSAKDLPYPLREGLEVIALTECLDNSEALVSGNGATFNNLPPGARIGTSSAQRKKGLLDLRKDIEIVSIRGTIEERIAQVDSGHIDALVVASCALKRLGLQNRISDILPFKAHTLQGMLAVVACCRKPALRSLFNSIDARTGFGKVWLVGAGPGDPDLITIKAKLLLDNADVILHDDLVSEEIYNSCLAEKMYVGKRCGVHSAQQESINELMYNLAYLGKRVVRLKGGDPFIFGRGGEEIDYLKERFIPVEVVPGITSAQGAAASLQVPLTIRHTADELSFISGHRATDSKMQSGKTAAVYMGSSNKSEVALKIKEHGLDSSCRVALVKSATTINESSHFTTVESLGDDSTQSPLMILAGPALATRVLPNRILYTGLDPTECLLDGTTAHYPLIRTEPIENVSINTTEYNGIVFTSRTAVNVFFSRFSCNQGLIYAIGPRTAQAIRKWGRKVHAIPEQSDSTALNDLIIAQKPGRLLYPCSDLSNNVIHGNSDVEAVAIYTTEMRKQPAIDLDNFDTIVFTSPSTVDSFFSIYETVPSHLLIHVYGQFTFKRLVQNGVAPEVIITAHTGKKFE